MIEFIAANMRRTCGEQSSIINHQPSIINPQLAALAQDDYNAFMQANQGEGIYMTKQQHAVGYSVALPVAVSSGKLNAIICDYSNGQVLSNGAPCKILCLSRTEIGLHI